jgi:uncharacterized protein YhaN
MKITDLKIDGFGVWRDLSLRGLSSELTVFYGPNEAGKSTLMQFMRSILYGVSPTRRERYMPPVKGGRPGGCLKVQTDNGPLTIQRYADRGPTDVGKVTIIKEDGEEQGDRLLREALEHVDEPTYLNIFAVGLREVQELGSLSDTAAAQWLYRLTSGLDRISLYDVIHMLEGTRLRLLNSWEEKSELRTMLSQREQLRGELDELVAKGRRWTQSAVKLRELAEEVDHKQSEAKALAARARRLEVAINIKPLWIKRGKIDDQLERFATLRPLEDGTIAALDEFKKRIEEHERQRDILKGQRQQLRDEAKRLGINDVLVKNGQRLEALLEQQDWLQAVQRMSTDLAEELKHLEARLASENERLSQEWTGAGKIPPRITSDVVEQLAPQARGLETTEQMVAAAKHELELHRTGHDEFSAQIDSATNTGEQLGLPKNAEAAGDLVAQLKRRQTLENRIEAAQNQAAELQQQAHDLVNEQVVPLELFIFLGTLFVGGVVALAAWWFLPATTLGKYGGWIALGGIGISIIAFLAKFLKEASAFDRFDSCHHEMENVLNVLEDAEREQEKLDHELNFHGGSVSIRLEHAERHLAELERVLPVESQRREAAQEISHAERRFNLAQEKHTAALANWKSRLRALGLPEDVSPANLAAMAGQCERLFELEAKIDNRRDDLQCRQREFTTLTHRITALAEECGCLGSSASEPLEGTRAGGSKTRPQPPGKAPDKNATLFEILDHLRTQYHQQLQRVAQRKEIRERAKALRVESVKHAHAALTQKRRRDTLFQKCGVADEQELRQLAAKLDEAEELRKKRAAASREIVAAIGRHGAEADFAPFLTADQIGQLERQWETRSSQSDELDKVLKDALQRRGAMVEQQRSVASDHSLAVKQIELDVLEQQLQKSVDAWRERAAVSLFLERIREEYEKNRQPETLREASNYMSQLTNGKYTRIWTPLAHDILFVDTADGQALSVQVLSRGTREQLFVSLRLALVAAYGRRGIHLPMILDDVFVNFDAGRTRTACAVLRDFAKQGHQLLVFTCHEHVWRMFQEIKVDCRRIPNRHGDTIEEVPEEPKSELVPEPVAVVQIPPPAPEPVVAEQPVVVEPKPAKVKPKPKPRVVKEPVVVEPDLDAFVDEPVAIEQEPVVNEIEYWWDTPSLQGSNGATHYHDDNQEPDWLPETESRSHRW